MLSTPETYDLTAEQALAHRADTDRPEGFEAYWLPLREAATSLPDRFTGTVTDPVNQIIMRSLDDVRVVAWLYLPAASRPKGVVITTHGYCVRSEAADPDSVQPWLDRGLAAVELRVRGYPPSTIDMPDLRGGWILDRIESAQGWVMRGAVVDLMCAYRCVRRWLGPEGRIVIHGESFGGGLATIAAAQLSRVGDPPHRLILGLPSFGDWRWRAGRYCNGSGGQVNMVLESMREEAATLMSTLRLFDSALHAAEVTCPTLVKLARCDDTVPAPSAAAVFNALGGPKWRFLTQFGHYDGGVANARRHARFERLQAAFADPGEAVEPLLRDWGGQLER